MEKLQLFAQRVFGSGTARFGGLEFAGRETDEGETDGGRGVVLRDGGEEIVFAGVEDGNVRCSAGSDDANNFAAHEFFPRAGRFHLIADSDFEAVANQAGDVAV